MKWMRDGEKIVQNVKIEVEDICLYWKFCRNGIIESMKLRSRQILAAKVTDGLDDSILDVYYVAYSSGENQKLIVEKVVQTFIGPSDLCIELKAKIHRMLDLKEIQRPKRWLIHMNPMSGWRKTVEIYHSVVEPLLWLCRISVHAIVLRDENHANEVLAGYDLSSIDAVVAMGGDGTNGQVTNALLRRTMSDSKLDIDDRNCDFVKPSATFGALPCGSGNIICFFVNLTCDIISNTISIILGNRTSSDAVSVHDDTKFIRQSNINATIGPLARLSAAMEKLRWMNKLRYIVMFPMAWFFWYRKDVEIEYKETKPEEREFRLMPRAYSEEHEWKVSDSSTPGWKISRCEALTLDMLNFRLRDLTPIVMAGRYQTPNLVSGKALLCVLIARSFFSFIKEWPTYFTKGRSYTKNSVVQHIEFEELRIKPLEWWHEPGTNDYTINLDGDPVWLQGTTTFHIRVHKACLDVFCVDDIMAREAIEYAAASRQ